MFDFGGDIVWEKLHASHSSGVKGSAQFVMTHPLIFYWLLYIAKSPDSSDAIINPHLHPNFYSDYFYKKDGKPQEKPNSRVFFSSSLFLHMDEKQTCFVTLKKLPKCCSVKSKKIIALFFVNM